MDRTAIGRDYPSVSRWESPLIVEKFSRFFRVYVFRFHPRHQAAPTLPLVGDSKNFSVFDALKQRIDAGKALVVQPNEDIVELLSLEHILGKNALVLLFHRASPNAADPAYRKKARKEAGKEAGKKFSIRTSVRERDEEQAVSSHLVIDTELVGTGIKERYRVALEEVPGISMTIISQIISQALQDYRYDFTRGSKSQSTYCVFKSDGLKSETMTNALKEGQINSVTLVRPAEPNFVDAGGLFQPVNETMRLRVRGHIDSDNWKDSIGNLIQSAKSEGWSEFNIEMSFDDDRSRTVKIDRDQEAKEILFVRSEQVDFNVELSQCVDSAQSAVVDAALEIARSNEHV